MDTWIYILIGIALGVWLAQYYMKQLSSPSSKMIADEQKHKEEHLIKLREYIKGKDEVTNDEVEKFLHISDATTERYLDELEQDGILKQMGKTGQSVRYKVL